MKINKIILILVLLISCTIQGSLNNTTTKEQEIKNKVTLNTDIIKSYKPIKKYYINKNISYLFFREYYYESKKYFLALNLNTLKTKIINQNNITYFKKANKDIITNTNYDILRKKSLKNSFLIQNSGIKKANKIIKKGIYLTIDMCPSSKQGFEKDFFEKLINYDNSSIAIAITYNWVKDHKKDFLWLLNNKKNLNITWVNHSKTHYYNRKIKKLSENFMLHNSNNLKTEILEVEKMLLLNNELPSIFFRFPGLVSNKSLINNLVYNYSLIPLGASNWLAKFNKKIKKGDIVLVHGNLNEHKGIIMFNKYLLSKEFTLLNLDVNLKK